jgi:hypothetical protein
MRTGLVSWRSRIRSWRGGFYLDLVRVYLHTMSQRLLHVLRVEVAQSYSTHSLVFDKILESIEVLRIVVLYRHPSLVPGMQRCNDFQHQDSQIASGTGADQSAAFGVSDTSLQHSIEQPLG